MTITDKGERDRMEIARLISWCEVNQNREARLANTVSGAGEGAEIYGKIATTLRSQAQHNADLIAEIGVRIHEASAANDLIRELEGQLTAPPPEEIAGLIKELKEIGLDCCQKAASALRSQAQEIERLKAAESAVDAVHACNIEKLNDRIRELENQLRIRTDREEWFLKNKHLFSEGQQITWLAALREDDPMERIGQLEAELDATKDLERDLENVMAERDAIQAKTLEECAQIADNYVTGTPDDSLKMGARWIAEDIRALAHKDEAKTE